MAHTRLSRGERKDKIVSILRTDLHEWHTVNSLAKKMEITPSTYLRNLLWELIEGKVIVCQEVKISANSTYVEKRLYAMPVRVMTQKQLEGLFNDYPSGL